MSTAPVTNGLEHVDVLIVGAGISGIAAAYSLSTQHADKTFAILEARGASGGTWDLFRYPGIRSDSDLHTFSYEFKPWREREGNRRRTRRSSTICARRRPKTASTARSACTTRCAARPGRATDGRWLVEIERTDTGEQLTISCGWLFSAGGYYRYDQGFTPQFDGRERFEGKIVHPQHWPEDLDYIGKRMVVIGSGATAVTLIPALAATAAHVTMLQRSPSYVLSVPSRDKIANSLPALLGTKRAYAITRRKNIARQRAIFRFCQAYPRTARWLIRHHIAKQLPTHYPVDEHFNPPYNPWDQRLCVVPDGDLFKAIRDGNASVVTDRIDTFTERGIRAGIRARARSRHHRDRHRPEPAGVRRRHVDRGRRGSEPVRQGGIPGLHARRGSQLRVRVRIHQLVVDAEGRARGRALLPTAGPHGHPRSHRLLSRI